MAGPEKAQEAEQLGMKRKRFTAEPVAANLLDSVRDDDAASDSGSSEQSEELLLDSFDQDIAEPIEAFNGAVTSTTAFLQPSEQLSLLARSAAKVCCVLWQGSSPEGCKVAMTMNKFCLHFAPLLPRRNPPIPTHSSKASQPALHCKTLH